MRDLIIALEARHPERAEVLEAISTIADTVDSLPLAPFFEPRSVILLDKGKGKRQLLSTTTDHIGAWAKHIAYACRFRMRTLEPTILREVCDGHLTASAILLRAHLETAGLAAHAFLTATAAVKSGNKDPLEDVMRKTMFGTALFKETNRVPELEEYLDFSDQCTVRASDLVGSLDRFLEPNKPIENRQRLRYALLCEWGHPNLRGFNGFSRVIRETEEGRFVQYTQKEDLEPYGVQMILEYMLEDMRLGYAASEFLRRTDFVDEHNRLRCYPPDPAEVAWIAREIKRLPKE